MPNRCWKCKLEKPEEEFYLGNRWLCKRCSSLLSNEYRRRPEVKERMNRKNRERNERLKQLRLQPPSRIYDPGPPLLTREQKNQRILEGKRVAKMLRSQFGV